MKCANNSGRIHSFAWGFGWYDVRNGKPHRKALFGYAPAFSQKKKQRCSNFGTSNSGLRQVFFRDSIRMARRYRESHVK